MLLAYEWASYVPDEVLFPVGRICMTGATAEDYRRIGEAAPDVARDLAGAGADVIAYACSVGSLFAGPAWEERLVERLAAASSKPAISIADASTRALRGLGARRIAVMRRSFRRSRVPRIAAEQNIKR